MAADQALFFLNKENRIKISQNHLKKRNIVKIIYDIKVSFITPRILLFSFFCLELTKLKLLNLLNKMLDPLLDKTVRIVL